MVLPVPVTFLFTNQYTVYVLSKDTASLLEPYFHLKFSAIPHSIIERLGEGPFIKQCSMKRTGNICVDRQ